MLGSNNSSCQQIRKVLIFNKTAQFGNLGGRGVQDHAQKSSNLPKKKNKHTHGK